MNNMTEKNESGEMGLLGDKLILKCEAIIEDKLCGKSARWMATWSDREMVVCDDHKREAQEAYDGDHEYDKTGIEWREIIY